MFSYDYFYRADICREALTVEDSEIAFLRSKTDNDERPLLGRKHQLNEVRTLLSSPPNQIVVVAGTNESGKSRFVSEILKNLTLQRGITYIQLAQMVDSLSTLTHALVRAFDLRWLQMRHSLVDVLPFAGSEILVMKERFSDRDLAQALLVVTEALASKAASNKDPRQRPVIVIDGLGEGSSWIRSPDGRKSLQRLIKWCIYVTKERQLAHIVLTGNEELVISLTDQNRTTRGHVKVIGLGDIGIAEVSQMVRQEIPDATAAEIEKITDIFGGFIHDIQSVSREIQARLEYGSSFTKKEIAPTQREKIFEDVISARFRLQIERITAAFSKGKTDDEKGKTSSSSTQDDGEELDPYLDPLKNSYSEALANQSHANNLEANDGSDSKASWSQLQLWQTVRRLVESEKMAVPFADLRDDVFDGDITPLIGLMNEDVLGFEVENTSSESGWSWEVKPATPALGRAFQSLVENSNLKERFQEMQLFAESREKLEGIEEERKNLRRERKRMDMRKASLLKTAELGKELGIKTDKKLQRELDRIFSEMLKEDIANEIHGMELRKKLRSLVDSSQESDKESGSIVANTEKAEATETHPSQSDNVSIQKQLRAAILKTYVKEGSKDKFQRFRQAFEALAATRGGIVASDVVKLIKDMSGQDVELSAAEDFIRTWDSNADTVLNYEEFVTMLLSDPKIGRDATREPPKDLKKTNEDLKNN